MADIKDYLDPKQLEIVDKFIKQVDILIAGLDKIAASSKKLDDQLKSTELAKVTDKQKTLNEANAEAEKINKQLIDTQKKIAVVETEANKNLLKAREALAAKNKAVKESIKETKSLNEVMKMEVKTAEQAAAQNKALNEIKRKLVITDKDYNKTLKEINATQDKNNKLTLSQNNLEQKRISTIGKYGTGIKNLMGAFGLIGGIQLFAKAMKDAFNTVREFGKESAILAGVLGKQRNQIKQLTEQAKDLGGEYPVTSRQVLALQTSYARLGFTQQEIINLTEATINGAIALNADLGETAGLVGATVRAFEELDSADSSKIMDILTLSTQKSSLSFESLQTALPKVAGAANAMGISLEKMSAELSISMDATQDSSVAGTSLRNIYLELSKSGLTMEQALQKINSSQNKLNTANELFGKRSAITALALANNVEKTKELEQAYNNAGGTAERVAQEQMKTLDGSLKGLESSWERLTLSLSTSEGVFSKIVNWLAAAVDTVHMLTIGLKEYNRQVDQRAAKDPKTSFYKKELDILINAKKEQEALNLARAGDMDGYLVKLKEEVSTEEKLTALMAKKAEIEENNLFSKKDLRFYEDAGDKWRVGIVRTRIEDEELYLSIINEQIEALSEKNKIPVIPEDAETDAGGGAETIKKNFDLDKKDQEDYQNALKKALDAEVKLMQDQIKEIEAIKNAQYDEQLSLIDREATQESIILRKKYNEGLIGEQDYRNQLQAIVNNANIKKIELEIQSTKTLLNNIKEDNAEKIKLLTKLKELELQLVDATNVEIVDSTKETEDTINEIKAQSLELAKASIDFVFQYQQDRLTEQLDAERAAYELRAEQLDEVKERDIERMDEALERELAMAEGNEVEQERIKARFEANKKAREDKYRKDKEKADRDQARREGEIIRKQAVLQKAQSLVQAAINTAVGISASLTIPVGGIALAAIVAALGAVQIASIASQPLPTVPKYKDGEDFSAPNFIAGEAGREIGLRNGKAFLIDKPTYFTNMRGTKIFNNAETEKILASKGGYANIQPQQQESTIISDIVLNIDENGISAISRRDQKIIARKKAYIHGF